MVMWDRRHWKGELVEAANQMVTCELEGVKQAFTWYLSVVVLFMLPVTQLSEGSCGGS